MRTAVNSAETKVVGKNRLRATLFFALAIVAGLAGLLLFVKYMDKMKGALPKASESDSQPVIVAEIDLPIATLLQKQHLAVAHWPKKHVPKESFKKIDVLIGRTIQQALVKGEPILERRLADSKHGRGMAALLEEGMRAMTVKVNSVVGVAGFVKPGDFVDVITTMTPDLETKETLENEAARVSKIILQNIKVLAVGEHLETEGRKPVRVKVVTMALTPDQTERLALASQYGKIQLTMRSGVDLKEPATAGITPLHLLIPDDGAEELLVKKETGKKDSRGKRWRRKKKKEKPEEDPKPKAERQTVEILRGSKITERKLRIPETDE